jgi:hypothetical protein
MHQGNPSSKTGLKVPKFVHKTPEFDTFFAQSGFDTKEAVSVSIMAKMVGLSRARFYQLIGTAFPHPVYSVATRRPFYDEEAQQLCLEVRKRNCGIDGKPILFYARHTPKAVPKKPKVQILNVWVIEGLKSLGLAPTSAQVEAAIKSLFPRGIDHVDQGEVIRSVFIHLKSKGV